MFRWGCREVFGQRMLFPYSTLTYGYGITGGTGVGKTRRVLLPLLDELLIQRGFMNDHHKWAALIIDPKLSFAGMFEDFVYARMQSTDYRLLNGTTHTLRINPLMSGLPAQKIAEVLNASLFAGAPMSVSSGAAYYEKRAVALLGILILLAQLSSNPSLEMVSMMADALSHGKALSCSDPRGAEAVGRVKTFLADDPREQKMVLSSIHNVLEPFRAEPWRSIFYEGGMFHLDLARDEGRIIVAAFSPHLTHNLHTGLYLLKQLWFSTVMARMDLTVKCNRTRYCFYIADEFQQICGRGSEAEFFAVRREARGCPIVAFQQISQVRSALGDEWEAVLGLLTNKIFLRNPDPDVGLYAQKLAGEIEVDAESVTETPDFWRIFYEEKSRNISKKTIPRLPADYLFSLPDGDAILLGDRRLLLWFPDIESTLEAEKAYRKEKWPDRPYLLHPRQNLA